MEGATGTIAKTQKYIMNTYARLPIAIARGSGVYVWDEEGKRYLDFVSGIAVNALGHCHPAVVEAITRQANQLMHTSNLYYTGPQARVAELLIEGSPFDRVFFCNSGAEANEAAIKLARKYGKEVLGPGHYEIITAWNSFHGRTLAAITATGQPKYQKGFEPLPAGFKYVPLNDVEALRSSVNDSTCALMFEPIQGESGVKPMTGEFLKEARRICDETGALLILDEVQTGLGRTGKMFAFQHYGVEPDIISLAKALGGGLPMGAMLAKEHVASHFEPGSHASTFGGNPVAAAAACAVIKTIVDDGLIDNARDVGGYFMSGLSRLGDKYATITEVRGMGLMVGLGLSWGAKEIAGKCLELGLLVNPIGDTTIRFLPPLIVTRREVDEALAILDKAMDSCGMAAKGCA
ncbi:MAG TPA: acetylornithine transaminase [Firmicutes bacterium]|nr:acetylornithine transaminase [Bacillota bacterium]